MTVPTVTAADSPPVRGASWNASAIAVALPLEDRGSKQRGGKGSRIGKLVVYEYEQPGRISLILVGQSLGY